ncbi:MAG: type II toxin-antitoxin system RelE/ParE family toxin [Cyclobacteriaceae bacterium]
MKIIWSDLAKAQLYDVYEYYKDVASTKIAKSIKSKVCKKVRTLSRFPEMGQHELNPLVEPLNFRYLVSGNYKIIYQFFKEQKIILIASIFDTRQNPNDLKV